ncbi:MAG: hypothetical protein DIJKHBIC_01161 [Thermoanaerobaculia bacterium]|nr:hypothetical protein [Thermoanaerobaculia bacterium]
MVKVRFDFGEYVVSDRGAWQGPDAGAVRRLEEFSAETSTPTLGLGADLAIALAAAERFGGTVAEVSPRHGEGAKDGQEKRVA